MTRYTISVRELKTHFNEHLKKAEMGHTIVITLGDKPIAELSPIGTDLMNRAESLQAKGVVAWNGKKVKPAKPVLVNKRKKLASDIYMEMQNDSLY